MAWTRDQMAARAAQELEDGYYVNLGIGIPTLVANHIPAAMQVTPRARGGRIPARRDILEPGRFTPGLSSGAAP